MDRSYWYVDDKGWLKERKETWNIIRENLLRTQYFDRDDFKYIEEYYLRGVEPCDDDSFSPDKSITLLLVIKLALHPSRDACVWETVKEEAVQGYDAEKNVKDSYLLLFRDGSSLAYNGEGGLGFWFFGGVEEKLVRFFTGEPGCEKTIEVNGRNYDKYIKGDELFLSFLKKNRSVAFI